MLLELDVGDHVVEAVSNQYGWILAASYGCQPVAQITGAAPGTDLALGHIEIDGVSCYARLGSARRRCR